MKEIEVKILEIEPEKIVARLKELGAEKVEQGKVYVKHFDFEDDRLENRGLQLRVRKIADRVELTYKGPELSREIRTREEIEVILGDFDGSCTIFENLGMKTVADYEKYRATYTIGEVKIEIDKYPGCPWLAEVESGKEDDVRKVVGLLGFDINDTKKIANVCITKIYGPAVMVTDFADKNESPDYDKLFE